MASRLVSVRISDELLAKCDKVAKEIGVKRNRLMCLVLERVCDKVIEEMEKQDGKSD